MTPYALDAETFVVGPSIDHDDRPPDPALQSDDTPEPMHFTLRLDLLIPLLVSPYESEV